MAYTEFYIRTTGDNRNAGSTNTDAAAVTSTNGNWSTTTNIFAAASGTPFSGVSVGDWASIFTDAASSSTYHARVTAVNSGGASVTLSATAKSGTAPTTAATGISCRIGGAWATMGGPGAFIDSTSTNSNGDLPRINMTGTHTYSSSQTISSIATVMVTWEGYTSSPGDGGYATIDGGTSGASYIVISLTGNQHFFKNFWWKNNGSSGTTQWLNVNAGTSRCYFYRITCSNCRGAAFRVSNGNCMFLECEAFSFNAGNGGNGAGFSLALAGTCVRCTAYGGTNVNSSGFNNNGGVGVSFVDCIAWGNTGSSGGGLVVSARSTTMVQNCTFYGNSYGINVNNAGLGAITVVENCHFESNTTWAVSGSHNLQTGFLNNNSYYNNGGAGHTNTTNATRWVESGGIDISSSGLKDPANGDFTPIRVEMLGKGVGSYLNRGGLTSTPLTYPSIGAVEGRFRRPPQRILV